MKKRRLGRTGLMVSEIGLGTMTFGSMADEAASLAIIDKAFDRGVDFLDVAEIYPVPPDPNYAGRSEQICGKWLSGRPRDSVILATKVAGPGGGWFQTPVRSGRTALDRLVEDGKVRAVGCSNESAYGLTRSFWMADRHGSARFETIQNNFNLLNRRFQDELARECGTTLVTFAVAWTLTKDYLGSTPIGATGTEQLDEALAAAEWTFPKDSLRECDRIHREIRYPMG